jgi:hypothetical protein
MHLDLQVSLRIAEIGGKERPPMWIETPNAMPPYGTAAFRRTRVWIYIRRDILNGKPFEWLVAGIAHELSHVVLFSIGHPLQHNEKAVDLTAMILGYQNFVVNAERTGIRGGGLGVLASLVLLPFGILFSQGRRVSVWATLRVAKRTSHSSASRTGSPWLLKQMLIR